MHLDHIDELVAMEARLDGEVDRLMAPVAEAATWLLSIPGVGKRVAEIGEGSQAARGGPGRPTSQPEAKSSAVAGWFDFEGLETFLDGGGGVTDRSN